jgi:hypothetical protein
MITNVVSSAARLSLAPARLASRVAGSLVRELRGASDDNGHSAPSRVRSKPATGSRQQARPKRATSRSNAKAKPKRASRTRAQRQPKQADTRSRAKAQAKGNSRPKATDDGSIAQKVESAILRGTAVDQDKIEVNVAERVVRLRGEVQSLDLANELEARAAMVAEVRRVENLLVVPQSPAGDAPAPRRDPGGPGERLDNPADMPGAANPETPTPASALRSEDFVATDEHQSPSEQRDPPPVGNAGGAADSPAGNEDVGDSADLKGSAPKPDENSIHPRPLQATPHPPRLSSGPLTSQGRDRVDDEPGQ